MIPLEKGIAEYVMATKKHKKTTNNANANDTHPKHRCLQTPI